MHLTLSSEQRILLLVAALLILFVIWIRLLAQMDASHPKNFAARHRALTGVPNRPALKLFPRWKKYLASILLGNAVYFLLYPHLPAGAQHRNLVDLGTLVDLWFCVVFYGLIELGATLIRRRRK